MLERLKWGATLCLIIGFTLWSARIELGFWIQITGGVLWLIAAAWMKDRPLIVTNAAMTLGGLLGYLVL
jgi:hypothetical protein